MNTEEVKQMLRALQVAINRMESALIHLADPDLEEKDPDLAAILAEAGHEATCIAYNAMSKLPGQIGVDIMNELPGYRDKSSFGIAFKVFRDERNKAA